MEFISWGPKYETGLSLIDAQHKKLFMIINAYHNSETSTDATFWELITYVDLHFKTEEYYFDKFNYKFSDEHKIAHKYYKDKVVEMHDKYLKDEHSKTIRGELEEFVKDWITDHIIISDMMYKSCFSEHGLSENESPVLIRDK